MQMIFFTLKVDDINKLTSESSIVQTVAERRRREAGVKQSIEIRLRSCGWVCMYGIWNYLANQGT